MPEFLPERSQDRDVSRQATEHAVSRVECQLFRLGGDALDDVMLRDEASPAIADLEIADVRESR
jgi:hypothetical protein